MNIERNLLSLGLAALLAACSADDSRESGANSGEPVVLQVSSVSALSGGSSNTRADGLPIPVTIGTLVVGTRAGNGYTEQSMDYTYGEPQGWTTSGTPIGLSDNPLSLWAYHPRDATTFANDELILTQQTYTEAKDLGYAASGGANVCAIHPYANFVLRHLYARVKIDIVFSLLHANTVLLNQVSLTTDTPDGFLATAQFNVSTGVQNPSTTFSTGIIMDVNRPLSGLDNRRYTMDELMVPLAADALKDKNPTLTVTLDEGDWKAPITALTTLEAGKSYRIKVRMGAEVVVNDVTVEDWIGVSVGSPEDPLLPQP